MSGPCGRFSKGLGTCAIPRIEKIHSISQTKLNKKEREKSWAKLFNLILYWTMIPWHLQFVPDLLIPFGYSAFVFLTSWLYSWHTEYYTKYKTPLFWPIWMDPRILPVLAFGFVLLILIPYLSVDYT